MMALSQSILRGHGGPSNSCPDTSLKVATEQKSADSSSVEHEGFSSDRVSEASFGEGSSAMMQSCTWKGYVDEDPSQSRRL